MGSPFKPLGEQERGVMQQMVDEYFARFINVVRTNRTINEAAADNLLFYKKPEYAGVYSGRVYSGDTAKKLGLVDETGLLSDAIKIAKTLANANGASVVMYKRPYGYGGSIYASTSTPTPKAEGTTTINLPGAAGFVPAGFYFLWRTGI